MSNKRITLEEYFDCLQREYIVALIRGQIYPLKKDWNYYNKKEIPLKRKSIIEIASRNNFPSIFNNSFVFQKYKSEIYNEWGLPNFVYRGEDDRFQRRPKDIINYFQKGQVVSVIMLDNSIEEGTIIYTCLKKGVVIVKVNNQKYKFPYKKISRILFLEI